MTSNCKAKKFWNKNYKVYTLLEISVLKLLPLGIEVMLISKNLLSIHTYLWYNFNTELLLHSITDQYHFGRIMNTAWYYC